MNGDCEGAGSASERCRVAQSGQDTPAGSAPDRSPATFAGLGLGRPLVMGIVNVTPDSFSDGGETLRAEAAVARGLSMLADGADIIDVGGESTRPGALPVPPDEELARVLPVVRALAAAGALVSIDTRRASVMRGAIAAGARIVNDITALTGDPAAMPLVAASDVSVVLMHMQGEPHNMQQAPQYVDAPREVYGWLAARFRACLEAGLPGERIAVDPGIGFGKSAAHNLQIIAALRLYRALPCALAVGLSRKSFIGRLDRDAPPAERLGGSVAGALACVARGAHIVRVHDVRATRQALSVWQAIAEARTVE